MKKLLQGLILGLCATLTFASAFAYYDRTPLSVFTQTGRVTIPATGTTASAALASTAASSPVATMVVIQNLDTVNIAYVALGASNVVATTTGGFPVRPASTAVLSLGSATHAAAITAGSSVSVSFSTGY